MRKNAPEQRRVGLGGHAGFAGRPGQHIAVGHRQESLEVLKLAVAQAFAFCVDEPTQHQIHFLHAAMPRTEPQPAQARRPIEVRFHVVGHGFGCPAAQMQAPPGRNRTVAPVIAPI